MITRARTGVFIPHCPIDLAFTALLSALVAFSEPRGFKPSAKSPEWLAAMQEEIDDLHTNQTWELVPRPPDTNIVGSNWGFLYEISCRWFHQET